MKWVLLYIRKLARNFANIVLYDDTEPVEMLMACILVILSLLLFAQGGAILSNPAFHLMAAIGNGTFWGWYVLIVSANKFLSALDGGNLWRPLSVAAASFFWAIVSVSVWSLPTLGIGSVVYPMFMAVSLWLAYRIGKRSAKGGGDG